jgi:undecaprenyl diphosphate synthase
MCHAQVDPELLASLLSTSCLPQPWRNPDLLIRTGGERRLSNFLLWEAAYAELHFVDLPWPEFGAVELGAALRDYACRHRRFGGRQAGG